MHPHGTSRPEAGFTLLELMIVVAILTIVAGIGVPQYVSALRVARIQKAKQELVTIAGAIESYRGINGALPLTLYQVGFGGRRDPWGVLYCYLNYADGTGDGLEWALALGIVDRSAVKILGDTGRSSSSSPSAPSTMEEVEVLTTGIVREIGTSERQAIAASLTEVKDAEVFTEVTVNTVRRRDRYMFPLNTDYDLFSLGPNRSTAVSLGQALAQDDVIRANDGGFFGLASEY